MHAQRQYCELGILVESFMNGVGLLNIRLREES